MGALQGADCGRKAVSIATMKPPMPPTSITGMIRSVRPVPIWLHTTPAEKQVTASRIAARVAVPAIVMVSEREATPAARAASFRRANIGFEVRMRIGGLRGHVGDGLPPTCPVS